jgi:sugar/nucleoside kinase (ribokinase family)
VLGLHPSGHGKEKAAETAKVIRDKLGIHAVVVHPTAFAAVATAGGKSVVDGPYTSKPLISTGAGDHFNAGFCLGAILGCDPAMCLQVGVATSGYYVRTAKSPSVEDLVGFLKAL